MLAAYWGFIFMSLHLGLHWGMILEMIRKAAGVRSGSGFRAIPHNGARIFDERFCPKRKYGKCGNTLCISHFSHCTIGAKDPSKTAAPIVRCCLRTWGLRAAALGFSGFGLYAFFKNKIPDYLFLRSHFVFFDWEQPLVLMFLEYIAMVVLWVCVCYYLLMGFREIGKIEAWMNR